MDTFKVGNRAACRCASTSARPSSIVPPDLVRGGTGAAAGGRHRVLIERRDRSSSDRSGEAAAMAAVATTGSAGGPGAAGRRPLELGAPSARSLLVTVLGEFLLPAGGWVWTGTLVGVLGVLGIEASAARQALARSAADGWLVSERTGRRTRWRLTEAAATELAAGAERIYGFGATPAATGTDQWLLLFVSVPEDQRQLRHKLRTRLAWAGFGMLARGAWLSPDPDRETEARRVLAELGLLGQATSFVARFGAIGEVRDLVARAWDLEDLRGRYERFVAHFESVQPQPPAELLSAAASPGWVGLRAAALFHRLHADWAEPAARCWAELASSG